MNNNRIRTLIIDDEPPARALLRHYVAEESALELVTECGDGCAAVAAIEQLRPDLILLDIEMPLLDGFGVLNALDPARIPNCVFVTAYDHYAVKAFDSHAVDYLLKPFDRTRFQVAMARVKERLFAQNVMQEKIQQLLTEQRAIAGRPARIVARSRDKIVLLRCEDIFWIEAQGNYMTLHAEGRRYQLRQTLDMLEHQLDPQRFCRIQRSTIVNVDVIRELAPLTRGDYEIVLRDDTRLKLNRSYRAGFDRFLGAKL